VLNDAGEWIEAPGWWMMGGNYAATSDSRFSDAIEAIGGTRGMAVKIHDRIETPDFEVTAIDGNGVSVVIGTVRRRGMQFVALDRFGGTISEHTSTGDAIAEINAVAGVRS
jgi:hypothetical protein